MLAAAISVFVIFTVPLLVITPPDSTNNTLSASDDTESVAPEFTVRLAPVPLIRILFTEVVPELIIGSLATAGIITLLFVISGTQAGFQLQALFQSVSNNPVQVIFTLPGDVNSGVHGLYVTVTLGLGRLVQLNVPPVHLAKKVFVAVITGVLSGKATVLLAVSYQVIVNGESQPLAVSVVVVPEIVTDEGVAVGLVGAAIVAILTSVVADAVHPLEFVTVKL